MLRAAALAVPPLWTALGVRQAAGTLRHYLRGAGRPYRVDDRALLAVPVVRAEVDRRLAQWRAAARALGEPRGTQKAPASHVLARALWCARPRVKVEKTITRRGHPPAVAGEAGGADQPWAGISSGVFALASE
ncbi:hypothetical protein [Streptomyces sp. G-G2]|uniref:hypothetical protein n=1 Tax=Streptomyces sp. G-G2 TaxID=3046201 RepID=UPI0024B99966|nr:hypothetical protein [Streptomyces sp. G-G2]MDJ0379813.1 hypothetical protein [Streptomyces sp. G-G2]